MSEEIINKEPQPESVDQLCCAYDPTCQNCRAGVRLQHKKWTSPTGWCKEKEEEQKP